MIHRLRGDILASWVLYPAFEERVIKAAKHYDIPVHEMSARIELRQRFTAMPVASGYWLFTDEKGEPCGHVASWLVVNFGILSVFGWQLEGAFTADMRRQWAQQYDQWFVEINFLRGKVPYIPMLEPVRRTECVTNQDSESWTKYLARHGFEVKQTVTLIQFQREDPRLHAAQSNGIMLTKGRENAS